MHKKVGICYDESFLLHDTGKGNIYLNLEGVLEPELFIENPWRLKQMMTILKTSGFLEQMELISFQPANFEQIALVHIGSYIEKIMKIAESGGGDAGDGGTPMDSSSYHVAAMAVGASISAVDAVMAGKQQVVYCPIRPGGHHSSASTGMGFCIFNNAAIAAAHALKNYSLDRVLIIDWDAHHGNGTQKIFWESPAVMTASIHQDGLYPPGSGTACEIGAGPGSGFNVNIPLPAGSGNQAYWKAWDEVILPLSAKFRPQLIIINSGQDASVFDPLARMALTASGFKGLGERAKNIAELYAEDRLILLQEGGYSTTYSAYCSLATLEGATGLKGNINDPFGEQFDNIPAQKITNDQEVFIGRVKDIHFLL
jgi:acetoin utilization deacetylase AcuC-like enzyme